MGAVKETIFAGGVVYTRIIWARTRRNGEKRNKRAQITTEAVEKLNAKNAERTFSIKLNHNFNPGDYFLTLTYKDAPKKEEAMKAIKKYIDTLRRLCKKSKSELKWMLVTEYENKRIHHHLVVNNVMSIQELAKLWEHGMVRDTILESSRDYRKLANYLMKETSKTFRKPEAPSRLRYSCSRNLNMPPVYREEVGAIELFESPEAMKGYHVDEESVYYGENPFTGRPYLEYVQLPLGKAKMRLNKCEKRRYKSEIHDLWIKRNGEKQMTLAD